MTTLNTYDAELALYRRLIALTYASMSTLRPDELFDPESASNTASMRRGIALLNRPETIGFGDGIYSRTHGIYQIDLWVPRTNDAALKTIKNMSDDHVTQFWPTNGRGLSLTENSTEVITEARPNQTSFGREGAFLHEIVEVYFFVDSPAEAS